MQKKYDETLREHFGAVYDQKVNRRLDMRLAAVANNDYAERVAKAATEKERKAAIDALRGAQDTLNANRGRDLKELRAILGMHETLLNVMVKKAKILPKLSSTSA